MNSSKVTLAIDFGTSKTRVARENGCGWPYVLTLDNGRKYVPSSVILGDDGRLCFGFEADAAAQTDSSNYLTGFLHSLGNRQPLLGRYNARAIVQEFLAYVLDIVINSYDMQGLEIGKVMLTCPLCFNDDQREELLTAARAAGLASVVLVSAPEAVGVAYCVCCPEKAFRQRALIVNWGSGSSELACVQRENNGDVRLVSYYGDVERGGRCVDKALYELVMQKMRNNKNLCKDEIDILPTFAVEQGVRNVKLSMAQENATECMFSCVSNAYLYTATVTREEYLAILDNGVDDVVNDLSTLYANLSDSPAPEMTLLVGGMVSLDYVAQRILKAVVVGKQENGSPVYLKTRSWAKFPEAAVMGAVMLGRYRNPGDKSIGVEPVIVNVSEPVREPMPNIEPEPMVEPTPNIEPEYNNEVDFGPEQELVYMPELFEAAQQGLENELLVALNQGGDMNAVDQDGISPLWYAVQNGHAGCVNLLLAYCANPNCADRTGLTALNLALQTQNCDCLQQLIAAGADVNHPFPTGWLPLGYAAMRNSPECVQLLMQAPGICPQQPNVYGDTALRVAEKFGHAECAHIIRAYSIAG